MTTTQIGNNEANLQPSHLAKIEEPPRDKRDIDIFERGDDQSELHSDRDKTANE